MERERVDPVQAGDMPRLILYADDDATGASSAGTAPALDVTLTLIVQALTERATRDDAVADIDALVAQVKDCLLSDPGWVKLSQAIPSVRVQRSFKPQGEMIIGDARIQLTCTWREIYPPRVTQPLDLITVTIVPQPAPPPAPPAPTTIVQTTVAL